MTTTTAPTPQEKALGRVLTISRLNGWSVIAVAGLVTLVTLPLGDVVGSCVGLLAVTSGAMEVLGSQKLRRRDPAAMTWLVRSQLLLLAVILAYCASRLASYDAESIRELLTPQVEGLLQDAGIEQADIVPLVHMAFFGLYGAVALTCLLYQGGLALYYRSRTRVVTESLTAPPPTSP